MGAEEFVVHGEQQMQRPETGRSLQFGAKDWRLAGLGHTPKPAALSGMCTCHQCAATSCHQLDIYSYPAPEGRDICSSQRPPRALSSHCSQRAPAILTPPHTLAPLYPVSPESRATPVLRGRLCSASRAGESQCRARQQRLPLYERAAVQGPIRRGLRGAGSEAMMDTYCR